MFHFANIRYTSVCNLAIAELKSGAAAPHSKTQARNASGSDGYVLECGGFSAAFLFAISETLLIWILGPHRKRDPAARRKLRRHNRFTRRARFYEIVQNSISDRFVKRALVPIGREIELERLAFDAKPVWHVIDVDPGKIGLPGDWAKGSEIICFKADPIIPPGRIWERFQPRFVR